MKEENNLTAHTQEECFLKTFPLIRCIAARKLIRFDVVEDITQKVLLKLWSWKSRRPEINLSEEEWRRFANTATNNEIKDFYTDKSRREVLRTEINENVNCPFLDETLPRMEVAGNSKSEVRSLLLQIWKTIENQSLREKYGLLLKRQDFVNRLIAYRVCSKKELAASLDISTDELDGLIKVLPLPDREIAVFLERKLNQKITSKQVLEARHRIKSKLKSLTNTNFNDRPITAEKTFVNGKT